jgi:Calcineurin-like phosphoesterase
MTSNIGLDVIGDVHGNAAKLESLLRVLGFREQGGVWRHPTRRAVFVGDLIDRGPQQVATLELVKAMIDADSAELVLGNHEFNAVAWSTPKGDGYCRPHNDKNRKQHAKFLAEVVEDSAEHRRWIDWFMTIPLWLDLGALRVVHACWTHEAMAALTDGGLLGDGDTLTKQLVKRATTKPPAKRRVVAGAQLTPYDAIEWLLKGPEVPLGSLRYIDKDCNRRDRARYKCWDPHATPLPGGAHIPPGVTWIKDGVEIGGSPAVDVPAPYRDPVPVIFGHYWCNDDFEVLRERMVCVDFSAEKGGPLAAYRWDGEGVLDARKLIRV